MRKIRLTDRLDYIQPQPYIVSSENYSDDFETPVLTAGQTFLLGKTDDKVGIYQANKEKPIILFDDFTTASKWVDFPFKVKSSACKILVPKEGANLRYLYYGMQWLRFDASQHKRYWISQYSSLELPDYSKEKEQSIVKDLDNCTSLISLMQNQLTQLDSLVKSRFMGVAA